MRLEIFLWYCSFTVCFRQECKSQRWINIHWHIGKHISSGHWTVKCLWYSSVSLKQFQLITAYSNPPLVGTNQTHEVVGGGGGLTVERNRRTHGKLTCATWWPYSISIADAGNWTWTVFVRDQSVNLLTDSSVGHNRRNVPVVWWYGAHTSVCPQGDTFLTWVWGMTDWGSSTHNTLIGTYKYKQSSNQAFSIFKSYWPFFMNDVFSTFSWNPLFKI